MRIVGGAFRGRSLRGPASSAVRPTSDRLRETIFDILAHAYGEPAPGASVADLFAGTGALGFEALSRGAARALFVDNGAEARALLRANIESLGVGGVARVFRRDAAKLGAAPPGEVFSLVFLDPPYGRGLAAAALRALIAGGWLAEAALVVVEEAAQASVETPPELRLVERRSAGATQLLFLRRAADADAAESL